MMSNEADGRISGNNIVTGNKGVGKEQHPRVNPVCGSVSTLRTKSPSADVKKIFVNKLIKYVPKSSR